MLRQPDMVGGADIERPPPTALVSGRTIEEWNRHACPKRSRQPESALAESRSRLPGLFSLPGIGAVGAVTLALTWRPGSS
jgi:hypothetical protein